MSAALELRCWGGGWGLPSLHADALVVMAYAKFCGAPLKVNVIDKTWRGSREIRRGPRALRQARRRHVGLRRPPGREAPPRRASHVLGRQRQLLHRDQTLVRRPDPLPPEFNPAREDVSESAGPDPADQGRVSPLAPPGGGSPALKSHISFCQIYRDAKECLNLLSNRLGTSPFFFGNMPTTLDAYVFGFLAPLYRIHFPKVQLQEHLKQLPNLCRLCDDILEGYFGLTGCCPAGPQAVDANLQKLTQLVNKESNLIEKMDDNLRHSPQPPHRKIPALKLTPAAAEDDPSPRPSP
ncbi:metaxin-3 isoform X3 [Ornithorhynchus anatinus]|uniref:metaxin-3 isoform X3 n=1 Tax=Ornithorhynchus anatinus TaxID=9258 RepID=UPI0010A8A0C7|nr:metaxin-3 isoform X3 [Ornithorhynchus anatinus]